MSTKLAIRKVKPKQDKKGFETKDFYELRANLSYLMDEVNKRLNSDAEYDAFSPTMWRRLADTADAVVQEIVCVREVLALIKDGEEQQNACATVAARNGKKKQQVAAYMAWNTMYQPDYASPFDIAKAVPCPRCGAAAGYTCEVTRGVHGTRRKAYRNQQNARALDLNEIRRQTARKAA